MFMASCLWGIVRLLKHWSGLSHILVSILLSQNPKKLFSSLNGVEHFKLGNMVALIAITNTIAQKVANDS